MAELQREFSPVACGVLLASVVSAVVMGVLVFAPPKWLAVLMLSLLTGVAALAGLRRKGVLGDGHGR